MKKDGKNQMNFSAKNKFTTCDKLLLKSQYIIFENYAKHFNLIMRIHYSYDTYKGIITNGKLFHQGDICVNDGSLIFFIIVETIYLMQKYY